jgi:hypothetical protein
MRPYTNTYNTPNSNTLPKFFKFCTMKYIILILVCSFNTLFAHNDPGVLQPGCDQPINFHVVSRTANTITVSWQSNSQFLKTTVSILQVGNAYTQYQHNTILPNLNSNNYTYTFNALLPKTAYKIKINKQCTENLASDEILILDTTSHLVHPNCISSPTTYNFIDSSNNSITLKWTTHPNNTEPISPTGRRFMVTYKKVNGNGGNSKIFITSGTDYIFDNLEEATKYNFKIQELYDGSGGYFTTACDEVTRFNSTKGQICNASSIVLTCEDSTNLFLKLDKPAQDNFYYDVYMLNINDSTKTLISSLENLELVTVPKTNLVTGPYQLKWCSGYNDSNSSTRASTACSFRLKQCQQGIIGDLAGYISGVPYFMPDTDCDKIADACDSQNNDGPCADLDGDNIPNSQDTSNTISDTINEISCNNNHQFKPPINLNLKTALPAGKKLNLFGFDFIAGTVKNTGNSFSGIGDIFLPFVADKFKINIENILVNTTDSVLGGSLNLFKQNVGTLLKVSNGVLKIGDVDFCVKKPEDPKAYPTGFDANGIPLKPNGWKEGDPYDPKYNSNGFDANGNYYGGGKYNKYGCNAFGLDKNGKVCTTYEKDYSWKDNTNGIETTRDGLVCLDKMRDSLSFLINTQLSKLDHEIDSLKIVYNTNCGNLRDQILLKANSTLLNYAQNLDYVLGPGKSWIQKGMHKKFKKAPEKVYPKSDRSQTEVDLENLHVDLYHCDLKEVLYSESLILVKEYKNDPLKIVDIKNDLIAIIGGFSNENAEKYCGNTAALSQFIFEHLSSIITADQKQKTENSSGSIIDSKEIENVSNLVYNEKHYDLEMPVAQIDNEFNNNFENLTKDFQFQYEQGFDYIYGVHRAFIDKAIIDDRNSKKEAIILAGGTPQIPSIELPFEIKNEVAGINYSIIIDNVSISKSEAKLDAYLILEIPTNGQKIVFEGKNLSFDRNGLVGMNNRLTLKSDISINLSQVFKINILGKDSLTYVNWDCNGFNELGIDGNIEICNKYIVPLDTSSPDLKPLKNSTIKIPITVVSSSWADMLVNVNIPDFALTNHDDYKWKVTNAVFDFSETRTSANMVFPTNYNTAFTGQYQDAWKGFYLQEIKLTLPPKLTGAQNTNKSKPTTITGNDIIIDENGFTGRLSVTNNILSLDDGNLGGWAFSIDSLVIAFEKNQLSGGGFGGDIYIPLLKNKANTTNVITKSDCLSYSAMFLPGKSYSFDVHANRDYKVPAFVADIDLDQSSSVTIEYTNDEFKANAVFNGTLKPKSKIGGIDIGIDPIKFTGLSISNTKPYFSPGNWGNIGGVKAGFSGFEVTLSNIYAYDIEATNEVAFHTNLKLQIGEEGKNPSFGADGGLNIIGKLEVNQDGKQRWEFARVQVDRIGVDASFPGVKRMKGFIQFFNDDPVYGDGFGGGLEVKLNVMSLDVKAVAIFGKKKAENYKYFMIDALATFSPGIGAGLKFTGFGGGFYYHMRRDQQILAALPPNILNVDPINLLQFNNNKLVAFKSLSDIKYFPDNSIYWGMRATVTFELAKKEAFNGTASLEIAFNNNASGAGLDYIRFDGVGRFMDSPRMGDNISASVPASTTTSEAKKSNPNLGQAKIAASVYFCMNFAEGSFKGDMYAYINMSLLEGASDPDKNPYLAGHVDIYIGNDTWYFWLGTPETPIAIKLAGIRVSSYFDIGKKLPPPAGIHPEVARILDIKEIVSTPPSVRESGGGFAFGAHIDFNGSVDAGVCTLDYGVGAGFDVMVQQYGKAALCTNNNNERIGVNGWYAQGQIYGYLYADFCGGLLGVEAAALLQLKGPNPTYARGIAAVNCITFLKDFRLSIDLEFGNQCEFAQENSGTSDLVIINAISSSDSVTSAPSLGKIKIDFNVPINKEFRIDENGVVNNYKIYLTEATIRDKNDKPYNAYFKPEWNSSNSTLNWIPINELPNLTTFNIKVVVQLRKNGIYQKDETRITSFTTDRGLFSIPNENIDATYPEKGMYNFYAKEDPNSKGYLRLKYGQDKILYGEYVKLGVVLTDASTKVEKIMPLVYEPLEKILSFPLENLEKNGMYKLEFFIAPKGSKKYNLLPALTNTINSSKDAPEDTTVTTFSTVYFRVSNLKKN